MADLSPQAQAVLDAYKEARDGEYINGEWIQDEAGQVASALGAAALRLRDVRWDGCIEPDAEIQIGLNWACDALFAIAAELENNND